MGLLDSIFGGGSGSADDPYADILTPAQRNQMQVNGLLAMAGAFADAGMPSRLPIPLGSALGKAAAALGAGQDAGMKTAIENALAAQKVRDLRNMAEYRKKTLGDLDPTSPLGRAINAIISPGGTMPAPGATPAGGATPSAGTGARAGAPPASAAGAPLTMETPYPGLLGGDVGAAAGASAEGEYGGGQKLGGLLGPAPDSQFPPIATPPGMRKTPYGFEVIPLSPAQNRDIEQGAGAAPASTLTPSETPLTPSRNGLARVPILAPTVPRESSGSSTAPAEPDAGAGGDTSPAASGGAGLLGEPWGPVWPQQAAARGPASGDPLDIIAHYESGNRNIPQQVIGPQGGYNPSVGRVTGPSSAGGPWQMIDPTWRAAAQKTPGAEQYPTALSAPVEVQRKVAQTLFDEQGYAPWAPYNAQLARAIGYTGGSGPAPTEGSGGGGSEDAGWGPTFAQGGPDRVIPSGPAPSGNIVQAQYAPGAGGAAPGAGAMPVMPQVPVPPGADPAKMNALILELARRNAASEVLGLGNPYNSLLTVLQGSPQYKAAVEGATEAARRAAGLPFVQPEAREKALGGYEVDVATRTHQANLDRLTNQIKDLGAAALDPAGTLLINGPNGPVERQVNRLQKATAQAGFDVPEIGFKGMNGPAPAGQIPGLGPAGGSAAGASRPQAQAITPGGPGTLYDKPALTKGEEALGTGSAEDVFKARTVAQDAAQSIETTKEARKLLDSGIFAGAGSDKVTALAKIGNALNLTGNNTKETVANTEAYFATVAGNVGRMIKQFGSGTGLSDADREYAAKMAAGQQTLDEASMRKILDINDRAGFNAINRHNTSVSGIRPGASLTPLTVTPPTPYQRGIDKATYDSLPSGSPFTAPDGSRRIKP